MTFWVVVLAVACGVVLGLAAVVVLYYAAIAVQAALEAVWEVFRS